MTQIKLILLTNTDRFTKSQFIFSRHISFSSINRMFVCHLTQHVRSIISTYVASYRSEEVEYFARVRTGSNLPLDFHWRHEGRDSSGTST